MYIALSYKRTPRTEVAYTSYLTSSLNISIGKTPVPILALYLPIYL